MLAEVASCALIGLEGAIVDVEADLSTRALPQVTLAGLSDAAVKESTERVRAAIVNSGLQYPRGRLTVNLAPADLRGYHPIEPYRTTLDLAAEAPPYAADFQDIMGLMSWRVVDMRADLQSVKDDEAMVVQTVTSTGVFHAVQVAASCPASRCGR